MYVISELNSKQKDICIMNKFVYILICLIFSVNFWNLSIVVIPLPKDFILFLTWTWILSGIYFFNYHRRKKALNSFNYKKTLYLIFLGIFISMFSAYAYGGQSFITTLIAQRALYSFVFFPVILFVQPTEEDIIKALKWVTIGTVIVWILVHVKSDLVQLDKESLEKIEIRKHDLSSKLEFYVHGIAFVVLYLYFKINEYIKNFSWRVFIEASLVLIFIILYQNRSMLLGVIPIFIYSVIKFKSNEKPFVIIALFIAVVVTIILTSDIWLSLINHTQSDLNETDYNRWKSLHYYLHDYSQSWFCYIFGNGFPSGGNSQLGNTMWSNFTKGIYASDLGMIGIWSDFGFIPLIAIYTILIGILKHRYFPMYLKFICLHIIFVPTIFHFWENPGISFFTIIFYLQAYHTELNKNLNNDVSNNNSKLQRRTKDNYLYKRRIIQSANSSFDSNYE